MNDVGAVTKRTNLHRINIGDACRIITKNVPVTQITYDVNLAKSMLPRRVLWYSALTVPVAS
jgi:hypothetical protein